MDFNDTPAEAEFRLKARAWIAANAPVRFGARLAAAGFDGIDIADPEIVAAACDWQHRKAAAGWGVLHWPRQHGGAGATPIERLIWSEEEGVYGYFSNVLVIGLGMVGPSLMVHGTEAQKARYLPPMRDASEVWCQLFSEPSAGSDLAAIRTRAERDGSGWRINGQKIWTSGARASRFGLLIARSDPGLPKHKGLTAFILDMTAPGVEILPIVQANGQAAFNHVVLTDVRITDEHRLGEFNGGWRVALTMLMNERLAIASVATGFEELLAWCRQSLSAGASPLQDGSTRARLAGFAARANGLRITRMMNVAALSAARTPGPENAIVKLVASGLRQEIATFAAGLQGPAGILVDNDQPHIAGLFQKTLLCAPGGRIAGGTDEIQRNIIAERLLGLPADAMIDKDTPFNRLPAA